MADVKISALPAATTPLAGTEVLPIVQSSTTKKVAISDVTAGRAISASSLTLTTTPLAVGSGGTGSSAFTANYIPYSNGTILTSSANFTFNGTKLGVVGNAIFSGTAPYIAFASDQSGSTPGYFQYTNSTNLLDIFSTGAIAFETGGNATPAMRLDASGNLGLGVTPSAWGLSGSGYRAVEVGALGNGIYAGPDEVNFLSNAYYNGGWKYGAAASTKATKYLQGGGIHQWSTAGNGTAGNAINFTQAMTLDASGNLGIGVSPSYRLDLTASASTVVNINSTATNGAGIRFTNSGTANGYVGSAKYIVSGALADFGIDVSGANNLIFGTNDTERARIDSSGNLLVGTTSTSETSGAGLKVLNTGGTVASVSGASTSSQSNWEMYSTGASAFRFYVGWDGTINATNTTISSISDRRFKENIVDLDVGLDALLTLKPRKFDWKAGKGKDIKGDRGWIADEFQQVFPDLIDTWKDEPPEGEEPYKSVRPDLMPVVVKAIQELAAKVAELEAKI